MAQIREELVLADKFSGTFNQFTAAAGRAESNARAFGSAVDALSADAIEGLTSALSDTEATLQQTNNLLDEMAGKQRNVTEETTRTNDAGKANHSISTKKNPGMIPGLRVREGLICRYGHHRRWCSRAGGHCRHRRRTDHRLFSPWPGCFSACWALRPDQG